MKTIHYYGTTYNVNSLQDFTDQVKTNLNCKEFETEGWAKNLSEDIKNERLNDAFACESTAITAAWRAAINCQCGQSYPWVDCVEDI